MKRLRALRPSLFSQVLGLVLLSLVAAQGVNLAIILLVPPPAPEFYRVSEIAAALRAPGKPVRSRNGRVLRAETRPAPPTRTDAHPGRITYFLTRDIGFQLGVEAGRVRLSLLPDGPAAGRVRRDMQLMRQQLGPEPPHGPPPFQEEKFAPSGDRFIIVPFEVGLKLPDGRWSVLRADEGGLLSLWRRNMLLWLPLSLLIVAPLAYLFARRLAGQITAFAAAVERLGRDPHASPMSLTGPREVQSAVGAFNDMQDRLRRYVRDRTEMVAAMAHDLRTPLTRLRFRIEGAPEPMRARMEDDIEQMEAMIASVMSFVRDATLPAQRRPLELASLVESIGAEMAETGLDVIVEPGAPVVVDADPVAIRRMVSNLLDNAVKFGVRARARVFCDRGFAVVEVEDDGPGLPEAERERVFEPFYRTERSRSRATGGVGLGLAVVRSVARAHGGDASLEDPRGPRGLRARATLPLQTDFAFPSKKFREEPPLAPDEVRALETTEAADR